MKLHVVQKKIQQRVPGIGKKAEKKTHATLQKKNEDWNSRKRSQRTQRVERGVVEARSAQII